MNNETWKKIVETGTGLGVLNATMRVWKSRGFVPARWHYLLCEAARQRGINLTIEELNEGRRHHFPSPHSPTLNNLCCHI